MDDFRHDPAEIDKILNKGISELWPADAVRADLCTLAEEVVALRAEIAALKRDLKRSGEAMIIRETR